MRKAFNTEFKISKGSKDLKHCLTETHIQHHHYSVTKTNNFRDN